ncbi:MAG: THUMP domain-containing protein [Candidatus Theseobacter exili]|nr:THUMP domain-containing protein [Candidatus Theseobacter exili]
MHQYQKTNRYFAQIADGREELGSEELLELNAKNIKTAYRGIYFDADKATLYRINYSARLISRVLAPIKTFQCHSTDYLYKTAFSINWTDFFSVDQTFAIFSQVSNSNIRHSQYASLRLKDAIVDSFRESFGKRPDVNRESPDVWFNLHIDKNRAVIHFDTSGGSLHKRGYRSQTVEAPMQETLAAAIIRYSGWDGEKPLYDLMCGSGTLLTEAVMSYCRISPGRLRVKFGFENLPDFDRDIWDTVKKKENSNIRNLPQGLVRGCDLSEKAVAATKNNMSNISEGKQITVIRQDFRKIENLEDYVIVCNPPYGIRIGNEQNLVPLFEDLGSFLKEKCKGSSAYIYFGNKNLIKNIGLRASWKKPLKGGGLDGVLVKYEIFK